MLQCKLLVKSGGGKTVSESVLTATSKTPRKKFKGTCRNWTNIGQKAHKFRLNKVESTDDTTKNSGTSGGNKSHVTTCYNSQQKGHFANKCTLPKKLKSDPTADVGMFVRVTFTDGPINGNNTSVEWDAGRVCNKHDCSTEFDIGLDTGVERTTIPCELDTAESTTAATMGEYVVAASLAGQSEELLLDSGGATCGVTYDKTNMTDLKPSVCKITIGNGDKVAT